VIEYAAICCLHYRAKFEIPKASGRRVVIVAYIGVDYATFLPNPKGIEICLQSYALRERFDRSRPCDWLNVPKDQIRKGDWLLYFNWTKGQARRPGWLYVDRVVPVRKSERGVYDDDFPFQAFQAEEPIRYDAPPFRVGSRFTQGLTKAIKRVGVEKVENSNYATPPRALLDALAQLKV
jgi:hypothetical protein